MTQSSYSKDTLTQILVDKVISDPPQDKIEVKKQKIVFGPDGSYTDVTEATPFPVSGTFIPGSPGWANFGQSTPKQVLVNGVSTPLLIENDLRQFARIVNNTLETIYIQYGISAVYGQGTPIFTNGVLEINQEDLFLGQINAITSGTAVNIDVIEGVK